jgi:hypothetical protein
MTTQLIFTEEFSYPDDPSGITVPVILAYGAKSFRFSAKVDTGAEVCPFSHEIGLKLGVPVEQGIPQVLSSLGGPLEAFGYEVTIQTGELAAQSLVYFAKYPGLPRNVLGRQGCCAISD